jgi:hypothetical protein
LLVLYRNLSRKLTRGNISLARESSVGGGTVVAQFARKLAWLSRENYRTTIGDSRRLF